jgi:predicted nuclease of predicted toxin-antitoxin system
MIFLADENVDQPIVDQLRADGHEVFSVTELEPSIPDDAVLSLASEHQCLLITADKDFGELVYRQQRVNSGVVLLRLEGLSSSTKAIVISLRSSISRIRASTSSSEPPGGGKRLPINFGK